jgi:glycosyltransferase involved in cell wall biosynthesis
VMGPPEAELRERFELGDAPLVLSVLAKRPHKNAARLIEAMARVPNAVLLMPGYSTGYAQELEEQIDAASLADRVKLLGWVDDATLNGLYRAADCFVFPSLAEGFGLPVLEAMLRGAPVACSSTTSLPEVAGDAALLFDPLDVDAIAVSIRRILEDEALAERMRASGLERAKRFTWEETAQRTLVCYRKALET